MKTLQELFNSKIGYETISDNPNYKQYDFIIEGIDYQLYMERGNDMMWEVEFSSFEDQQEYGITGSGNAAKVFATVMKIMQDFIKKEKPDAIKFEAKEKSRIALYRKLVNKFGRKFYDLETHKGEFILTRKK